MRFIALFLLIGVSAASGSLNYFDCRDPKPIPYSEELVKKAEAGDAVAQWNLGMCYSGGWASSEGFTECKEVKKNPEEAIKWLSSFYGVITNRKPQVMPNLTVMYLALPLPRKEERAPSVPKKDPPRYTRAPPVAGPFGSTKAPAG